MYDRLALVNCRPTFIPVCRHRTEKRPLQIKKITAFHLLHQVSIQDEISFGCIGTGPCLCIRSTNMPKWRCWICKPSWHLRQLWRSGTMISSHGYEIINLTTEIFQFFMSQDCMTGFACHPDTSNSPLEGCLLVRHSHSFPILVHVPLLLKQLIQILLRAAQKVNTSLWISQPGIGNVLTTQPLLVLEVLSSSVQTNPFPQVRSSISFKAIK